MTERDEIEAAMQQAFPYSTPSPIAKATDVALAAVERARQEERQRAAVAIQARDALIEALGEKVAAAYSAGAGGYEHPERAPWYSEARAKVHDARATLAALDPQGDPR